MSLLFSIVYPQILPPLSLVKHVSLNGPHLAPLNRGYDVLSRCCAITPSNSNTVPDDGPVLGSDNSKKVRTRKKRVDQDNTEENAEVFPSTKPRKPRRGRRSEAAAVEDFIRGSLENTFASIREQNPDLCMEKEKIFKERLDSDNQNSSDISDDDDTDDDDEDDEMARKVVVEEESPDWPLDADVGWGTRASEYFEQHPIKNVIAEDGTEIDWEWELDNNWVQEINCLEWEKFAFHPSPLVVLVFERYNRAGENWKVLKELEEALKVYWNARDKLPPRAVKLDINIERDLAYALKVRECPQLLFLLGNKILYREKEFRKADDIVQMIAFFYYKAKKPSWIDEAALA